MAAIVCGFDGSVPAARLQVDVGRASERLTTASRSEAGLLVVALPQAC